MKFDPIILIMLFWVPSQTHYDTNANFYERRSRSVVIKPRIKYQNELLPYDADISIQKNGNMATLICYAEYPIVWIPPDNSIYIEDVKPVAVTVTSYEKKNGLYFAYLRLENAEDSNAGFYTCISKENSRNQTSFPIEEIRPEMERRENRVFVNVYISDTFSTSSIFFKRWRRQWIDNSKISYIDCRLSDSHAKYSFNLEINDQNFSFPHNPRFGFEVPIGALKDIHKKESNIVRCTSIGNESLKWIFYIEINYRSNPVRTLIVPDTSILKSESFEDSNVTLTCSGRLYNGYCNWSLPNTLKQQGISKYQIDNPIITRSTYKINLILKNLKIQDSGNYNCSCIETVSLKTDNAEVQLHVRRLKIIKYSPYASTVFHPPNPSDFPPRLKFIYTSKDPAQTELLTIKRYFSTIVKETNSRMETLIYNGTFNKNAKSEKLLNNTIGDQYQVKFSIENTTSQTKQIELIFKPNLPFEKIIGHYTFGVKLTGDYESEISTGFVIDVHFKTPHLEIFINSIDFPNETSIDGRFLEMGKRYRIWCFAQLSRQKRKLLKIGFSACPLKSQCYDNRSEEQLQYPNRIGHPMNHLENIYQKATGIKTVAITSGSYTCRDEDENIDQSLAPKSIDYIVNDFPMVPSHLGIFVNVSHLRKSREGPDTKYVLFVGEPLHLPCKVQRFRPTIGIDWLFRNSNGTLELSVKQNRENLPTNIEYSLAEFGGRFLSHNFMLRIDNITMSNTGQYTCRSKAKSPVTFPKLEIPSEENEYNLGGEMDVEVSIAIEVREKPLLYLHDDEPGYWKTVWVKNGEKVELFCNITGDPEPSIDWTKNDHVVIETYYRIYYDGLEISDSRKMLTIQSFAQVNPGIYKCVGSNMAGTVGKGFELKSIEDATRMGLIFAAIFVSLLTTFLIVVLLRYLTCLKKRGNRIIQRNKDQIAIVSYGELMQSSAEQTGT